MNLILKGSVGFPTKVKIAAAAALSTRISAFSGLVAAGAGGPGAQRWGGLEGGREGGCTVGIVDGEDRNLKRAGVLARKAKETVCGKCHVQGSAQSEMTGNGESEEPRRWLPRGRAPRYTRG